MGTPLELLVLPAGVALLRNGDDRGIDDLPTSGLVALAGEIAVKGLEQLLDRPGPGQLFAVEAEGGGVGDATLDAQAEEASEGEPVPDLVLDLLIGEVVEYTEQESLEDDDRVPGCAS